MSIFLTVSRSFQSRPSTLSLNPETANMLGVTPRMLTRITLSLAVAFTSVAPVHAQIFGQRDRRPVSTGPLCTYGSSEGWFHHFNPYVAEGSVYVPELRESVPRIVPNRETVAAIGTSCDYHPNQNLLVDGEFSLNHISSEGELFARDVCGDRPTLIFKRARVAAEPENEKWTRQRELPTYNFYVPGSLSIITEDGRVYLNGVERALILFTGIIKSQCGKLPTSVRVVARDSYTRAGEGPYGFRQIYGGVYYPGGSTPSLVHDNPTEAARLQDWTKARNQWIDEREKRQQEANTRAAPMILAMIIAYAQNAPRCAVMTMDGICRRMAQ